jgi:hypothetical protein
VTPTDFAEAARTYALAHGASVTSWLRTPDRNRRVGGAERSAHLEALAVDLVYDHPIPEPQRRLDAELLGLRLIVETDHDHLQPLDWRP